MNDELRGDRDGLPRALPRAARPRSRGLAARRRLALFPLWFLAIAGVGNALAHPLCSAQVGGYFPGLVTSPLVGVAGLVLARRLFRVTAAAPGRW